MEPSKKATPLTVSVPGDVYDHLYRRATRERVKVGDVVRALLDRTMRAASSTSFPND